MTRAKGFTLAELIVVIAIIVVLIAIALPVLFSAKESGKAAVDTSQIRQMVMSVHRYALDYDDNLPKGVNLDQLEAIKSGGVVAGSPYDADLAKEPPIKSLLVPYVNNQQIFLSPLEVNSKTPTVDRMDYRYDALGPLILVTLSAHPSPSGCTLFSGPALEPTDPDHSPIHCAKVDGSVHTEQRAVCLEEMTETPFYKPAGCQYLTK